MSIHLISVTQSAQHLAILWHLANLGVALYCLVNFLVTRSHALIGCLPNSVTTDYVVLNSMQHTLHIISFLQPRCTCSKAWSADWSYHNLLSKVATRQAWHATNVSCCCNFYSTAMKHVDYNKYSWYQLLVWEGRQLYHGEVSDCD